MASGRVSASSFKRIRKPKVTNTLVNDAPLPIERRLVGGCLDRHGEFAAAGDSSFDCGQGQEIGAEG
jgi:hypothetical protein